MRMSQFENKVCGYIEKHLQMIVVVVAIMSGLIIRYGFMGYESADFLVYLRPWFETIKEDGMKSLANQVGDYNIPYQAVIACLVEIGADPLWGYKLVSIVFDVFLAIGAGFLANFILDSKTKFWAIFCAVFLLPDIFLNSSCWGQCDSIYVSFLIFSLLFMLKDKPMLSLLFYGIAISFKLQAIFLLPFFLFYWFIKRQFSLLNLPLFPS